MCPSICKSIFLKFKNAVMNNLHNAQTTDATTIARDHCWKDRRYMPLGVISGTDAAHLNRYDSGKYIHKAGYGGGTDFYLR
jgi:hypothetical protein